MAVGATGAALSWMLCVSSLLGALPPFGILLAARRPHGHSAPLRLLSALLGILGALLVTRRFPVCCSLLATRCLQWPSCSLLALLVARWTHSFWHVVRTYLIVWHCPVRSALSSTLRSPKNVFLSASSSFDTVFSPPPPDNNKHAKFHRDHLRFGPRPGLRKLVNLLSSHWVKNKTFPKVLR